MFTRESLQNDFIRPLLYIRQDMRIRYLKKDWTFAQRTKTNAGKGHFIADVLQSWERL